MTAIVNTPDKNTTEDPRSVGMASTLRACRPALKSPRHPSAWVRLGRTWGMKPETAKDRVYGERGIYQMVAEANREFIADGYGDRVAFLMAPIDASLMGQIPDRAEAEHVHNVRDAAEDVNQAEWMATHSDAALEAYIKSLASDIHCAEKLLAALITERDNRRAAR